MPLEDNLSKTILSDNILIDDIKRLGLRSDILVSNDQIPYAVYHRFKDPPVFYEPFGPEKGSIMIDRDLVVLDLNSRQRKVYGLKDIVPVELVEFLRNVPPSEGGSDYSLHFQLSGWVPGSENVFWGKLMVYPNADPPMAIGVGLFKMDIKDSKIENFVLPGQVEFGAVNVNVNAEKVLYESFGDDLSLYLYDLKSKENKRIVSYGKDVFDKYCSSTFEYVYTNGFYGNCGRDRGLRADWDGQGEGISYFDFITRKRVDFAAD